MAMKASASETPDYLLARLGNISTSNAHYFKRAHVTEITPPPVERIQVHAEWNLREQPRSAHEGPVTAIAVSPDASVVVSGGADGKILAHVADKGSQPSKEIARLTNPIAALAYHPMGQWLVATDTEGTVWIWDTDTWTVILGPLDKMTDPATGAYFLNSYLIVAPREVDRSGRQKFQLIEMPSGMPEPWINGTAGSYTMAAFNATETATVAAFGQADGSITFWNEQVGGQGLIPAQYPHKVAVSAIAVDLKGARAASGDANGVLAIWDPATGAPVGPILNAHDGAIRQLVFDPKFPALYTAGDDGRIPMFGVGLGDTLIMPLETGAPIYALAIADNGKLLAAGDENGRVHVWFDASHAIAQPLKIKPTETATVHSRPAIGVMLTHEQSWAMQGIALGELLHSVSLAPGEITQLAISNHTQSVLKNSVDAASQSELMQQKGTSASDLHETEKTDASEFGFGSSSASSTSHSSSDSSPALLGLLGFTGGAAYTNTTASTASFSMGHRDVSDSSNQSVHQSTNQRAAMARRRFSAAVQEVSESDSLELKTRVVANYNHMHALNLQYYEVVQVQRLRTRVVDAHRLLFIPMKPTKFSDAPSARTVLERFPHQIASILHLRGYEAASIAVGLLYSGVSEGSSGTNSLRQTRFNLVWSELNRTALDLAEIKSELKQAETHANSATNAVLKDRDTLRKLQNTKDAGVYDRNLLQQSLIANQQMEKIAKETLSKRRSQVLDLTERLDVLVAGRAQLIAFLEDAAGEALSAQELEDAMRMPEPAAISEEQVVTVPPTASEDQNVLVPPSDLRIDDAEANTPATSPEPHLTIKAVAPILTDTQITAMERYILEILAQRELEVNQHLWLTIDPTTYSGLLQGRTFRGQSIEAELDPSPVATAGHYVGFRWHHRDAVEAEAFRKRYVDTPPVLEDTIALPTGGVFGEAVLGESNVADKIDLTRFWDWKDALPPIRPTGIDALKQPGDIDLTAPDAPKIQEAHLDLGQITFPEVASGIPSIIDALKNPALFDNMSGTKASAALAASAMQFSAMQDKEGGRLATENFKRHLKLQRQIADTVMSKLSTPQSSQMDPTMAGGMLNANGPQTEAPERLGVGEGTSNTETAGGEDENTTGDTNGESIAFFEDKGEENGEDEATGGTQT